jgi:hypothetical protein
MATYLMLLNWTDQGIRNIKESPKRMKEARQRLGWRDQDRLYDAREFRSCLRR